MDSGTLNLLVLVFMGIAAGLISIPLAKRRQDLQDLWRSLPPSAFEELSRHNYQGLNSRQAKLALVALARTAGRFPSGYQSEFWSSELNLASHQEIEAALYIGSDKCKSEPECKSQFSSIIFLRWRLENTGNANNEETQVVLEYYCRSEPLNPDEQLILDQFKAKTDSLLKDQVLNLAYLDPTHPYAAFRQAAFQHGAEQSTLQFDSGKQAGLLQSSTAGKFSPVFHYAWVQIPQRIYSGIDPETALELLCKLISSRSILNEAHGAPLQLLWQGYAQQANQHDPVSKGIVETTIRFSEYAADTSESLLDQELVMSWKFAYLPASTGKTIFIDCKWRGLFKQSSGDIVRHLLEKLELELEQAGAQALGLGGAPIRKRRLGRQQRQILNRIARKYAGNEENQIGSWPSMQEFNEAIQNPKICFLDEELKAGEIELTKLGLPRVMSGAFASVYRLSSGGKDYAVRCFNNAVNDQEERYRRTSRFICSDDLTYTVPLYYLEKGILVRGNWYPVLKMEWVDGISVYQHIENCLGASEGLLEFQESFHKMLEDLKEAGIAHGDLQHGNLLVAKGELVLVDYDGMFVPELSGFCSNELGHPNYQHPERSSLHFGPYLDNFSAWLIDTALLALRFDPELWTEFGRDAESLLFKRADLENPKNSLLFARLKSHQRRELKERAAYIEYLLTASPERIPFFCRDQHPELLSSNEAAEPIRNDIAGRQDTSNLPDWLN